MTHLIHIVPLRRRLWNWYFLSVHPSIHSCQTSYVKILEMDVVSFFSQLLHEYPPFWILHNPMKYLPHNDILSAKVNTAAPWSYRGPLEHTIEPGYDGRMDLCMYLSLTRAVFYIIGLWSSSALQWTLAMHIVTSKNYIIAMCPHANKTVHEEAPSCTISVSHSHPPIPHSWVVTLIASLVRSMLANAYPVLILLAHCWPNEACYLGILFHYVGWLFIQLWLPNK